MAIATRRLSCDNVRVISEESVTHIAARSVVAASSSASSTLVIRKLTRSVQKIFRKVRDRMTARQLHDAGLDNVSAGGGVHTDEAEELARARDECWEIKNSQDSE